MIHSQLISRAFAAAVIVSLSLAGCCRKKPAEGDSCCEPKPATQPATKPVAAPVKGVWRDLFDGKSLDGWAISDFGGQGEVKVKDGVLVLPMGALLTGVTYTKPVPTVNYEIQLEARKVDGTDFFVGLTFPYKDSHATLICGGWGGAVTGISSINGFDASQNETTKGITYEDKKWYQIKVRVEPNLIKAWLDNEEIVDLDTTDKKIDIRIDISESKPLGVANYQTTSHIRKFQIRELPE